MEGDDVGDGFEQYEQPLGERQGILRRDHAVCNVGQARAMRFDHAPAGLTQARVQAEDSDGLIRVHRLFQCAGASGEAEALTNNER